jgi:hypothetical protein
MTSALAVLMTFSQPVSSSSAAEPRPAHAASLQEQNLGDLVSQISRDAALLARQEVALAKQEAADKAAAIKGEAVGLALGAVALHAGELALVAALVLGLTEALQPWLAALVSALILLGAGALLLLRAKARLAKLDLSPRLVVDNVERDVSAIKEAAK